MAGDWIPAFADLPTKREVLAIASLTGRNRHEVVGRLVEFWIWAQTQSDGSVDALVDVHVDALETALGPDSCFWQAVTHVGWLRDTPAGLVIPNAMHWLSRGAKARLKKTLRQNLWRQKASFVDDSVDGLVDGGASTSASTTVQYSKNKKPPIVPLQKGDHDTTKKSTNGQPTWITPFADAFRDRYHGEPPVKRLCRIIAPVRSAVGDEVALHQWRSWLTAQGPRYNLAQFPEVHGSYDQDADEETWLNALGPMVWTCGRCHQIHERPRPEAKRLIAAGQCPEREVNA